MMKIGLYGKPSNHVMAAIQRGAEEIGLSPSFRNPSVFTIDQVERFDIAVTIGLAHTGRLICDAYRAKNVPVFVVDASYIFRDKGFFRFGINGLNWLPESAPPDRARDMKIEAQSMPRSRTPDKPILVCGQKSCNSYDDIDFEKWREETLVALPEITDREVIYRPHPAMEKPKESLSNALKSAHALVTHNSTAAYEAIYMGIPVVCSPGAVFSGVCTTDLAKIESLEVPTKQDRQKLLNRVAYGQWTIEEYVTGKPLQYLMGQI